MRILYFDDDHPTCTSRNRADALRRIGHEVVHLNPWPLLPQSYALRYFNLHTGYVFAHLWLRRRLQEKIEKLTGQFDLALVNSGEWFDKFDIEMIRTRARVVITFNNDDPFGARDGARWRTWLSTLPTYDAVCVVRDVNVAEAQAKGARLVWRVWMSCDEVAHAPRSMSPALRAKWESDVAFIGTWMPERGPILANLVQAGLPLAIWGNRWYKAKEWSLLRNHWRGNGAYGEDYAYAIQAAKVAIGLVSKENRDEYTTRTAEIPHLGTVLCAEDTPTHREIFRHRQDAWLFSSPVQAIEGIQLLLQDSAWREAMALNGRQRVIDHGLTNERVMTNIVSKVSQLLDGNPQEGVR